MPDQQPPVSEVTCKAAVALAASATGVIADGTASEDQRAEAARLLRAAADMLAPARVPGATCRCSPTRSGTTYTVNATAGETASEAMSRSVRSAANLGAFV